MKFLGRIGLATAAFGSAALGYTTRAASTFTNPAILGCHSDPFCVHATELDNTPLCTSSTFMTFPGAPIYASKDLVN
ncbi:hypothetical protein FIE12Z_12786 [Fusarium flagelliforme]|uniref:Uncharacterized protein n=1 Tax=Fusarium flagelliforme TaxID=2675880 RepID=A0A395M541_9HYPO|nr:hypothetical protein FIE12Z_12786 [Fusarium flagelliforme]